MTYSVQLISHPATNTPLVHGIEVHLSWSQDDTLTLSYTLRGKCSRLKIPEGRLQAQVDGLWQHTCFEAFVAPANDTAYWEVNFSPSGEWAMYQFRRYRERVAVDAMISPPQIVTHQVVDRLTVEVRLRLPQLLMTQLLRIGLSAVIEDNHGQLSYWALQHPAEKPDFHHADAFVLEIPPVTLATIEKELS